MNSYNSWGLRAGQWQQNSFCVETMLEHLAKMLNSNEQFKVDNSFQLVFVHVCASLVAEGKKRKLKPGHQSLEVMQKMPVCSVE